MPASAVTWMPARSALPSSGMPAKARAYVDRIAETMEAEVDIVSVGPGRDQTIVVNP